MFMDQKSQCTQKTISPKLLYRFNAILIKKKIPTALKKKKEIDKWDSKIYTQKWKGLKISKTILESKDQFGRSM